MNTDRIALAGGCFWGMQDLLRKIPGVISTQVGYCGGRSSYPTYPQVCTGGTGHAEAVLIEFNPAQLSLSDLLLWFFRMHDPTTLNQQGNDKGSQYRSEIFCWDRSQLEVGLATIKRVEASGFWKSPVETKVSVLQGKFWPAEEDHQDYLQKNVGGYSCHFIRKTSY